jgi:hypothetical protein
LEKEQQGTTKNCKLKNKKSFGSSRIRVGDFDESHLKGPAVEQRFCKGETRGAMMRRGAEVAGFHLTSRRGCTDGLQAEDATPDARLALNDPAVNPSDPCSKLFPSSKGHDSWNAHCSSEKRRLTATLFNEHSSKSKTLFC